MIQGKDAVPFLEHLVVGDIAGIPNGSGSLSMFTNENGGIIDDTVVTKVPAAATAYQLPCFHDLNSSVTVTWTANDRQRSLHMTGLCTQVADDEIYLVVNAGCREKDINHLRKHLDAFSVSTSRCVPRSVLAICMDCPNRQVELRIIPKT